MHSNPFVLLLIVVLALSFVVRCDVRHAVGETVPVTQREPRHSTRGAIDTPQAGQAACPLAPGHPQKGGPHGPARPEATSPEDVQ